MARGTGPHAQAVTRWVYLFDQVRPDVVTVRYNLLSPLYTPQETDIFAFARRRHVGVLIKQALGQGLLLRPSPWARPCWSAAATPIRSPPPSPAWATRSARTRSPRSPHCSIHPPTKGHQPVQYIEVEKKFALPDPTALKAKLAELGAKTNEPTRQVDTYYNAPHKDFLAPEAISEWLRIRTEDRGSSINYKCWHPIKALIKPTPTSTKPRCPT
jgi:hypothetical protein